MQNEKIHNLYSSPVNTFVIKPGRMMQAGHVALMGKIRIYAKAYSVTRRQATSSERNI
jgi:hypothetical protein